MAPGKTHYKHQRSDSNRKQHSALRSGAGHHGVRYPGVGYFCFGYPGLRYFGHLLLWTSLLCLSACAASGKRVIAPDAKGPLMVLNECRQAVQGAKGTGKLTVRTEKRGTEKGRLVWIAGRPSALRLEVLGIWGQPLYRLLFKHERFYLHDVTANKYFHGKANKQTLKRLIGVAVDPEHLHSVLMGCLPLASFQKAEVQGKEGGDPRRLSLYAAWNRLTETMVVPKTPAGEKRAAFFDARENPKYEVRLYDHQKVDGVFFPHTIEIATENRVAVTLDIAQVYVNRPVPARAFDIEDFQAHGKSE